MTKQHFTKFDIEQIVKDNSQYNYPLDQKVKSISVRNYGQTIFYIQNIIPVLPMGEEVFKADEGCFLDLSISVRFDEKVISDASKPSYIKKGNNCVIIKSYEVCQ